MEGRSEACVLGIKDKVKQGSMATGRVFVVLQDQKSTRIDYATGFILSVGNPAKMQAADIRICSARHSLIKEGYKIAEVWFCPLIIPPLWSQIMIHTDRLKLKYLAPLVPPGTGAGDLNPMISEEDVAASLITSQWHYKDYSIFGLDDIYSNPRYSGWRRLGNTMPYVPSSINLKDDVKVYLIGYAGAPQSAYDIAHYKAIDDSIDIEEVKKAMVLDRQFVSPGTVLMTKHKERRLMGHSCNGEHSTSGAAITLFDGPVNAFVGIHEGCFSGATNNIFLSIDHPDFVKDYAKFVVPTLPKLLLDQVKPYLQHHKALLLAMDDADVSKFIKEL